MCGLFASEDDQEEVVSKDMADCLVSRVTRNLAKQIARPLLSKHGQTEIEIDCLHFILSDHRSSWGSFGIPASVHMGPTIHNSIWSRSKPCLPFQASSKSDVRCGDLCQPLTYQSATHHRRTKQVGLSKVLLTMKKAISGRD